MTTGVGAGARSDNERRHNPAIVIIPLWAAFFDMLLSMHAVAGETDQRLECETHCTIGLLSLPFTPVWSPLAIAEGQDGYTSASMFAAYAVMLTATSIWWWYLSGLLPMWSRRIGRHWLTRGMITTALFVAAVVATTYAKAIAYSAIVETPAALALAEAAVWGPALFAGLRRRRRAAALLNGANSR